MFLASISVNKAGYIRVVSMLYRQFIAGLVWLLLLIAVPASALVPPPADLREEAVRYKNGEGVSQDYVRAYELYCLAALQGDSEAAYHLGSMHLNGWGRTPDDVLAAGWFSYAEKRGDASAGLMLQEHLDGVSRAGDPACPLVESSPDREMVTTWVHLMAPYYGLKPELVLSLIQVESNFDARAKSPKNAQGLMQLMPATAKRFGVSNIRNPIQNLQGGMAYLHWLNNYFSGNIKLVLAGYNAGEDAVKKYRGIPPYKETRLYVRRIVHIYADYIRVRRGISKSSTSYASKKKQDKKAAVWQQARTRNERALSRGYISPSSIK
jgi:TPR repeat protein